VLTRINKFECVHVRACVYVCARQCVCVHVHVHAPLCVPVSVYVHAPAPLIGLKCMCVYVSVRLQVPLCVTSAPPFRHSVIAVPRTPIDGRQLDAPARSIHNKPALGTQGRRCWQRQWLQQERRVYRGPAV
jgi:hypothetical protein